MKTMPRHFDLIAFDWDGTLFDSTAIITRCIQQAVADVGGRMPTDEQASYVIGMALTPALQHAAPDLPPDKYKELAARYRHHYMAQVDAISLFEGVVPLLEELQSRNHLLAVATGKSRSGLDEVLAKSQLGKHFHATRTADQTRGKPDPLMLHELMEELGVPPERTLMIGDTTHDLQMALNAGCASVGVSYGAHAHENFEPLAPRHVAHTVAELRDWLVRHG
ncbi:MAG: hypothetical protein RLZZ126_2024 [Pseudomonadota bacterium]|jgi:phosphoglycolate phosphatase